MCGCFLDVPLLGEIAASGRAGVSMSLGPAVVVAVGVVVPWRLEA